MCGCSPARAPVPSPPFYQLSIPLSSKKILKVLGLFLQVLFDHLLQLFFLPFLITLTFSFGAVAGFYGGWLDKLIIGFINIIWSVPTLLMVIAITLALGKGFWQVFVAVGITMWVEVARLVRGQVKSTKEEFYIKAGEVLGFSKRRLLINKC